MIISVWGGSPQPENMEVQASEVPHTQYRRLKVEEPSLESLLSIHESLSKAGVLGDAVLEFERWNVPATTWYVHAVWTEK